MPSSAGSSGMITGGISFMTAAGGATVCVPFLLGTMKVTRRATYSSQPSVSSGVRAPFFRVTAAGLMLNSRGGSLFSRMYAATSSAMSTGLRWLALTIRRPSSSWSSSSRLAGMSVTMPPAFLRSPPCGGPRFGSARPVRRR